jgi:hypothetical protein
MTNVIDIIRGAVIPGPQMHHMMTITEVERLHRYMRENKDKDHRVILVVKENSVASEIFAIDPDTFDANKEVVLENPAAYGEDITDYESW